ncbi:MAG: sulfotransferase [Chloroflexota bacterium]
MAGNPILARVHNRTRRLRQRRWRMAAYQSEQPHIVMGGAPRSGTTLLRRLFDRHPDVRSGAETKLFVPAAFNLEWLAKAYHIEITQLRDLVEGSSSQGAFIDAFADRVKRDRGKDRWAEKTPMNIRNLDWIMPRWPNASVIHIIRDGRDVVSSMRQHPDWRWVDGEWQQVLVPRSLETYARRWLADTSAGMAWRADPRYVEVRYEDLVADPAGVMRGICDGIGLSADAVWLAEVARPVEASETTAKPDYEGAVTSASVGRWRDELSAEEKQEIERRCRSRLSELGYEP